MGFKTGSLACLVCVAMLLASACGAGSQRAAVSPNETVPAQHHRKPATAPSQATAGETSASGGAATYQPSPQPPTAAPEKNPESGGALRFIVYNGGDPLAGWRTPVVATANSETGLTEVAHALAAAVVVSDIPPGPSCGPLGLMTVVPPPSTATWWEIGLPSTSVVRVSPNVVACGKGTAARASNYAVIDGHVKKAPGLLKELLLLTDKQPKVQALTVTPTTVSSGETFRVSGDGWVGAAVKLSVAWCSPRGKCGSQILGAVQINSEKLSWSGVLPSAVSPNAVQWTIDAENNVRGVGGLRLRVAKGVS